MNIQPPNFSPSSVSVEKCLRIPAPVMCKGWSCLTRENEEDTSSNSYAALGDRILLPNFSAFHAHHAHDDAEEAQEERNDHESPGCLDVNYKEGRKTAPSRCLWPQPGTGSKVTKFQSGDGPVLN